MEQIYEVIFDCQTNEETKVFLTEEELASKQAKSNALKAEAEAKATAKAALLERLGITAEEAQLLLGGN
jgi:hypothetical protein